jgi:hypothetical protein
MYEVAQDKTRLLMLWVVSAAVVVIEVVYLAVGIEASRAYDVFSREEQQMKALMGDMGLSIMVTTERIRSTWVDPQIERWMQRFDPAKSRRGAGMGGFPTWQAKVMQERLSAWQVVAHGVIQRVQMMLGALSITWPVLAACIVHALTRRKRALAVGRVANAVHYRAALRGMFWLVFIPLFFVAVPITWPASTLPLWVASLCAALYLSIRNVQES